MIVYVKNVIKSGVLKGFLMPAKVKIRFILKIYTVYRKKIRRKKLEFAQYLVGSGSVIPEVDPQILIRIRIRIKMNLIRNTVFLDYNIFLFSSYIAAKNKLTQVFKICNVIHINLLIKIYSDTSF